MLASISGGGRVCATAWVASKTLEARAKTIFFILNRHSGGVEQKVAAIRDCEQKPALQMGVNSSISTLPLRHHQIFYVMQTLMEKMIGTRNDADGNILRAQPIEYRREWYGVVELAVD